jgi:hypothetical protein
VYSTQVNTADIALREMPCQAAGMAGRMEMEEIVD